MRILIAAAFVIASSLAQAQDGARSGILVVNAPDGPTPQTSEEIGRLRQDGAASVTVELENVALIADDELLALIEAEISEMLRANGFSEEGIAFQRCPTSCPR